jgi:hypothetical protein
MTERILWCAIDGTAAAHLTQRDDGNHDLHVEVDGLGHVLHLTQTDLEALALAAYRQRYITGMDAP